MNSDLFLLSHLAVIEVKGNDSAQFLQGQLTIDIRQLTIHESSIAAFCNAKGRVITTLMVTRTEAGFLLVLPRCLLTKVIDKLRMYILRAAVSLHDLTEAINVYGVSYAQVTDGFPVELSSNFITLPGSLPRYLYLHWLNENYSMQFIAQQSVKADLSEWLYQDIVAGLAWLTSEQSEVFIPQMLGLDHLGGISFSKGCYTGQEIVARTHYLGQVKRQLFVAEYTGQLPALELGHAILDDKAQPQGQVIQAVNYNNIGYLLVLLQQNSVASGVLVLDNDPHSPLKLQSIA